LICVFSQGECTCEECTSFVETDDFVTKDTPGVTAEVLDAAKNGSGSGESISGAARVGISVLLAIAAFGVV